MAENLSLAGETIAATYTQLLHIGKTEGIEGAGTGHFITDANGTESVLSLDAGRVGIGTESPTHLLSVEKDTGGTYDATTVAAIFGDIDAMDNIYITGNSINMGYNSDVDTSILRLNYRGHAGAVTRYRDLEIADGKGTMIMYVDGSNHGVGIGTTTPSEFGMEIVTDTDAEFAALTLGNSSDAADTTGKVSIVFNLEDTGGNEVDAAKIQVVKEASFTATASTQDSSMVFFTSLNGTIGEKLRLNSDGNLGIGATSPTDAKLEVTAVASGDYGLQIENVQNTYCANIEATIAGDNNYTSTMVYINAIEQNADANFNFLETYTDGDNDVQHRLDGIGESFQDGGANWTDTDYAEYFETSDGKALAPGISVVLIDGKVRTAQDGEIPFGVVRPPGASCAIGGTAWNKWDGKYLKTPYGDYDFDDDGTRKLNPNFIEDLDEDGKQIYTPRQERDEWQIIGLLGQIPINKDQPTSPSWIKMWEVTDDVDMYYVFPSAQVVTNNEQGESSNE